MGEQTVKRKLSKKATVSLILVLALVVLGAVATGLYLLSDPETTRPEPTPEAAGPTPEPTSEPKPVYARGCFRCPDGLFYPERGVTRGELADALATAAGEESPVSGDSDETLTEETFSALLRERFPADRVALAMTAAAGRGDEIITRAEAAVVLDQLMGLSVSDAEAARFPDVGPDYWARGAVEVMGGTEHRWNGDAAVLPEPGFLWVNGRLCCADENGYFIKNCWLGSLYFGPDGFYTSGSPELDGYVSKALMEQTDDSMTREEKLRAMYVYVRDNFTYLRRNYYRIGDLGWQIREAVTMYSTGKGNCYCFASAFCAAARGLGYDAKAVSGTYGAERAPHGWVEIIQDGQRYTYDVEIEMVQHREGNTALSLYAMNEDARSPHGYIEQPGSDNMMPRETNEGLLPR